MNVFCVRQKKTMAPSRVHTKFFSSFWLRRQFDWSFLGETNLSSWSMGPTDLILSKNKKTILQHFDQLPLLIHYFSLFEKKQEIKHNKLKKIIKTKKHLSLL